MSDKAAKKKQYILDTAKTIFANKGFKDVTMKDIVEACDISRGGLYIYFDSTEAIFEEILKQDNEGAESVLSGTHDDLSSGDLLAMFLNEQKKAILNTECDLSVALYEYLFFKYSEGVPSESAKNDFESKVSALAAIIDDGVEQDELYSEDSNETAKNILFTIEGLKVMSKTVGISEKDIDNELLYILGGLIVEE